MKRSYIKTRGTGLSRGTSKLKARVDKQMVAWAKAVKERDEFQCQNCGIISESNNHAHHVATRKRRPDLKYEVSNGKTLCPSCHAWVHDNPRQATRIGLLSDATYERAARENQ